jgi:hypothetical protein
METGLRREEVESRAERLRKKLGKVVLILLATDWRDVLIGDLDLDLDLDLDRRSSRRRWGVGFRGG